jgi:ADP-heptose:LPS heptosyltransferase
LIIHPGALGDVLLALPAMRAIRERYPSQPLVLLAGTEVGRLLELCRVVDRALPFESADVAGLFAGGGLSSALRDLLEQCDAAFGWLRDGDGSLHTILQAAGISRIAIGSPTPAPGVHQSVRFMDLAGGRPEEIFTAGALDLPAPLKQAGSDLLRSADVDINRPLVVCHPGSGSPAKCLPPEVVAATIRGLCKMTLTPVIVGGPADDQAVQRVIDQGLHDIPVVRHPPLELLAGTLAHGCLFVGHDSGVTHLAAALRVPTVAIFGPTDPAQWAPQGAQVTVLKGSDCTCVDWEQKRHCTERPCLPRSAKVILKTVTITLARYHSVTKS